VKTLARVRRSDSRMPLVGAGAQSMGFFMTALLGVIGSVASGFFGGRIGKPAADAKFHPAGFLGSIIGAVIVLALWGLISR
jgi:uncharacterized membrane protein YeaQ/YmgE (transglycosylase-associated protein family)